MEGCRETLQTDLNSEKTLRYATENSGFNTNRSVHRANPGRKVVKIMCMHGNKDLKKMQKYTSQTSKWVSIVTLFLKGLIRAGNVKQDEMLPIIFKSHG